MNTYLPTWKVTKKMSLHAGGSEFVIVEPGNMVVTEADLGAWVTSGHLIQLNEKEVKKRKALASLANRKSKKVDADKNVEANTDEKKVTVDVGAMTATVDAGDDGVLGTEDDNIVIKPKADKVDKKEDKKGAKKEDKKGKRK